LEVFGGQLVVHMNNRGITGVNGTFIKGIESVEAALTADEAAEAALADVKATTNGVVQANQLMIYPVGLFEGHFEAGRLAWAVRVAGANFEKRVFIDALTGAKLGQVSGRQEALHRIVYSPEYDPDNPNANVRRSEGDPPAIAPPAVDRLYDFAGQVYELFDNGFGRDSYDGMGAIMRSVYLVNDVCPNAYWNSTSTNYCPGFDTDDIVAHEWGHAYTEKTHGLIYSYQSGALNESYSDIFGEIVDLHNGMDNPLSANQLSGTPADPNDNSAPYPDGQRWIIGEDLVVADQAQNSLLTRDMWNPDRLGSPGKVSSPNYLCGTSDGGGVHTNSGVPNHAFAILVDGQTYNGQTVEGIGFNRAAHIYYRAMTEYQVPSTNFAHHAESLLASCEDLRVAGTNLNDLFSGAASGETIRQRDCDQLAKAIVAVEMRTPPTQCGYGPMLDKNTPPLCEGAESFFTENFEGANALDVWTLASNGVNSEWPNFNWEAVDGLPGERAGSAAFAIDSKGGTCAPGGDISGAFSMDSPEITIPAGSVSSQVRFDHFVETELEFDGGNLMVSVNGGDFVVLDESQFIFNPPNGALSSTADGNTNPKAGELAWNGADGGEVTGSWGTTIVDLNGL
ncbi:MAG: M4 family metallopeptidase, partial [Woeseia sp.]